MDFFASTVKNMMTRAICTPLKSNFYFQFAPKTTGIKPTTYPSCMQNLVEIAM